MKIFLTVTILLAANAILQLFNMIVWDYLFRQRRGISIPRLVIDVINFLVLAGVAISLLKTIFGVNPNAFLVTSTVLSAVVGLSLQDVLGGVVAGMALQMERPFVVGDWVSISGEEGQIQQMSWRTLTLRTRSNNAVIMPNSTVTKQMIINYTRLTPFMLRIEIGLPYATPPGQARSALLAAVAESGAALEEPAPSVILKEFSESSIVYEVRFWATDYGRKPHLVDAVQTRIWYTLDRGGIAIPFPQRDVTLRSLPEDFEERRARRIQDEMFRELRSLPLFEGLSDDQIRSVSSTSALLRFTAGETLVRQGDTGDSMYVIKSGSVRVMVSAGASGDRKLVAKLGAGQFFGEMSLLTGEPRSASVISEAETEVMVLSKADFISIIASDANAVDALSKALSDRMTGLAEKAAESAAEGQRTQAPQKADIIRRIRGFFGI